MIRQVLLIGRWSAEFLFAIERYDKEGVLACLYDAGAPQKVLEGALELMEGCEWNCGLTFTNPKRKRAVILIGPTTGGDEFLSTFTHELRHLVDYIMTDAGVQLDTETPAYLTGDTARELANIVCMLGCDHCREELRDSRTDA